jgi:hypothetical protein
MARLKRSSPVLETARRRLAGLKSITPAPDFGPNLKLSDYEEEITTLSADLDHYNEVLSTLDQLQNGLVEKEAKLREKNKRMLAASEAHYGPDSSEYEQVGGTRDSERKRPDKKVAKKSTPSS